MHLAGTLCLMLTPTVLLAGEMGPRFYRSSLYDQPPTVGRVATPGQRERWPRIRRRFIRGAERLRVGTRVLALGLTVAGVILLVIS